MRIKRILVPSDFSQQSLKALDYAVSVAREHEAEIVLVHAIEPLPRGVGRWMNPAELIENYRIDALRELARLEKDISAKYPRCRTEVGVGSVDQVVANLACELEADVVVIAVQSQTGFFSSLFGGVAENLIRHAPCPVVSIPGGAHEEVCQETTGLHTNRPGIVSLSRCVSHYLAVRPA